MSHFDKIIMKVFNNPEYCNRINHPIFSYRKYRRGYARCKDCGGKIKYKTIMVDNIYNENPMFKLISAIGRKK